MMIVMDDDVITLAIAWLQSDIKLCNETRKRNYINIFSTNMKFLYSFIIIIIIILNTMTCKIMWQGTLLLLQASL